MKHTEDARKSKLSQSQNDEIMHKLLESIRKACQAMIDTIDAYQNVTQPRGK